MSVSDTLSLLLSLNACQCFDVRLWKKIQGAGLDAAEFVRGGEKLWERLGILDRSRPILADLIARGWAQRELDACAKMNVHLLTCEDADYPNSLFDLKDPPLLLYLWGMRKSLPSRNIAVVGTRKSSPYGKRVAKEIGHTCSRHGWGLVSGGARGIDGAAHEGALEAQGSNFAVLGTGIDQVFPSEHALLFEHIKQSGALVSEYPLGVTGRPWRFPRRNRIISALADRLVVVEAPHRSGAMITARCSMELGREVWAVPGRIDEDVCSGSNQLLFDGAHPLIGLELFFGTGESQKTLFPPSVGNAAPVAPDTASLDSTERLLLQLLSEQGDRTVDNLATEAKMSAADVSKKMVLLAAKGWVFCSAPGRYRACSS